MLIYKIPSPLTTPEFSLPEEAGMREIEGCALSVSSLSGVYRAVCRTGQLRRVSGAVKVVVTELLG